MADNRLKQFVEAAAAKGTAITKIKKALSKAGWKKNEIDHVTSNYMVDKSVPVPVPKKDTSMSISVLLFFMFNFALLIFAYYFSEVIFEYINYYLPLAMTEARDKRLDVIMPISVMIVALPLAHIFYRNYEAKKDQEGASPTSAKISYILIFISALMIAGTLSFSIYRFLEGDISIRFILKSAYLIILAIAFLMYFKHLIHDGRGNKKINSRYVFPTLYGLCGIIFVSTLIFAGTPFKRRLIQFDEMKADRIRHIKNDITHFYKRRSKLPKSLNECVKLKACEKEDITDPQTNENFEYNKMGKATYQLCADFNFSHEEAQEINRHYYIMDEIKDYEKGKNCFKFEIQTESQSDARIRYRSIRRYID
jgi:hypothetical protein